MITIKRIFTYSFDNVAYRRQLEKLNIPLRKKLLDILDNFEEHNFKQAYDLLVNLDAKEQQHLNHIMWMTLQQHQDVQPQHNQLFQVEHASLHQ